MSAFPDSPTGRTGYLSAFGKLIPVRVGDLRPGEICRCGGPVFDIEVTETTMLQSASMVLAGTRVNGCVTDILLSPLAPAEPE